MTEDALRSASAREVALYQALVAAYRTLAARLDGDAAVVPTALAAGGGETDGLVAALRELGAVLGPERLAPQAVPHDVAASWRATAALAAEAAELNAALVLRAQARQTALALRLAELAAGRRALAAYRPVARPATAVPTQRA